MTGVGGGKDMSGRTDGIMGRENAKTRKGRKLEITI